MKKIFMLMVVGLFFGVSAVGAADTYNLDPVHTTIGFKVQHLGISYVTGKFDKFEGQVMVDGEMIHSLQGAVDVNSINTDQEKRDGHLKSDDFFSSAQFPMMKFTSTKITQEGGKLAVFGDLTIRDVTKPVLLNGNLGGFVNMNGTQKLGFVLSGEINRQDFGLKFNKILETGNAVVADTVIITLEIEADQQTPKAQ